MLSLYLHPNLPAIVEIVLLLSVALTVLVFMFKSQDINNGSVVGMLVLFAWMLSIVGLHAYVTHDLNSTAIPPEKLSLYSTRFPVNSLRSRILNGCFKNTLDSNKPITYGLLAGCGMALDEARRLQGHTLATNQAAAIVSSQRVALREKR